MKLKRAILLLLIALTPLRVLAAVTVDDCAISQQGAGHHHHETPTDHGTPHSHGDAGAEHDHCASASFAAPAVAVALALSVVADRLLLRERFAGSFVPDQLDPPPLPL